MLTQQLLLRLKRHLGVIPIVVETTSQYYEISSIQEIQGIMVDDIFIKSNPNKTMHNDWMIIREKMSIDFQLRNLNLLFVSRQNILLDLSISRTASML